MISCIPSYVKPYYGIMRESQIQGLKLQLEEAIQMLRLVANQERTCVEVQEWLAQNYPESEDDQGRNIVDLLVRSGNKHER